MTKCPACDEPLTAPAGTEVGELLECENCSEEVEVLETEPSLEVGPVPIVEIDGE